jgi:hypothetical protein
MKKRAPLVHICNGMIKKGRGWLWGWHGCSTSTNECVIAQADESGGKGAETPWHFGAVEVILWRERRRAEKILCIHQIPFWILGLGNVRRLYFSPSVQFDLSMWLGQWNVVSSNKYDCGSGLLSCSNVRSHVHKTQESQNWRGQDLWVFTFKKASKHLIVTRLWYKLIFMLSH